jgi:hypothetical protein
MKAPIFSLVVTAVSAALLIGCGSADWESDAAYPQAPPPAVGYTPPPPVAATQPAFTPPPPAEPPPGLQQPGGDVAVDGESAPAEAGYGADDQYAETDPSALTDFRTALDPYGSWVDDPTYGTVWVPSSSVVGSDFTPYATAGHWTYDDDYTWVSDYDWGWAPFHYGRWAYASPYGWEWVPGRRYAGAWVSWRYGWGDWPYVGWAPLGPTWGWRGGRAFGLGYPGAAPYSFCASRDLFAPRVSPVLAQGSQIGNIGAHTRPWVGATPTVNGRVAATPRVNGPPPQILNIPASSIAHGATADRGVVQARAFAHAGTATAMGGHAPAVMASRASGVGSSAMGRSPTYGPSVSSHFGGKLGYGFRGSASNAPPSYSGSYGHPYFGGGAASHVSYGGYGGGYGGGGFHGGGGYYGAPGGIHPGVQPGQGGGRKSSSSSSGGSGYHGGGFRGGGGGRGGGGHR